MKIWCLTFSCLLYCTLIFTQENSIAMKDTLPYYQIPDAPSNYTASTVVARTIDGLGYRYYWATEGLRIADLAYTPGNDGQNCEQVLHHIFGLSNMVLSAVKDTIYDRNKNATEGLTWNEVRAKTLYNIKEASDILRDGSVILDDKNIIFQRGENISEFPFWNVLNGPLADAMYHTGQIVSYRRSAGNPMSPNVSVFSGKNRK